MKTKTKRIGFIVEDCAEDWQQPLQLVQDDCYPKDGILDWCGSRDAAFVFATRQEAKAAIARTEHYRLAFNSNHPEKKFCKIVPLETRVEE